MWFVLCGEANAWHSCRGPCPFLATLEADSCVAMMPHALVCAIFDGLEPMLLPDRRFATFTVSLVHNT